MSGGQREISLGFMDEKVREGQHIVYLYNDDWDRKRTMAKFLQQGLIDNDKVIYLVDDLTPNEMRAELLDLGVDIEEKHADIDITKGHYTQCPNNYFSREFMLRLIKNYYMKAINEGYDGVRGAGEMSWALTEGRVTAQDLIIYETELNNLLMEHPLTTVCQYDARRFDGAIIMDILSVHPKMIVRGQLVKNPCYLQPEFFLSEYKERLKREADINSG